MKQIVCILLATVLAVPSITADDIITPRSCGTVASDTDSRSCAQTLGDVCMLATYPANWICVLGAPESQCYDQLFHRHDEETGEPIYESQDVNYTYKEGICEPETWNTHTDDNGNIAYIEVLTWTCSWGAPQNRTCTFDHSVGTRACPPPGS